MCKVCKVYICKKYNIVCMQVSAMKTIRVSDEMHEELVKLGNYGDSMDDIIRRLVISYKDENKK